MTECNLTTFSSELCRHLTVIQVVIIRTLFFAHSKVAQAVTPCNTVSRKAVLTLDDMMRHVLQMAASESSELLQNSGRITLSERDMRAAVKLLMPGELGHHVVCYADQKMMATRNKNKG